MRFVLKKAFLSLYLWTIHLLELSWAMGIWDFQVFGFECFLSNEPVKKKKVLLSWKSIIVYWNQKSSSHIFVPFSCKLICHRVLKWLMTKVSLHLTLYSFHVCILWFIKFSRLYCLIYLIITSDLIVTFCIGRICSIQFSYLYDLIY